LAAEKKKKGLKRLIFHVKASTYGQYGLARIQSMRGARIEHPAAFFFNQLEIIICSAYFSIEIRAHPSGYRDIGDNLDLPS